MRQAKARLRSTSAQQQHLQGRNGEAGNALAERRPGGAGIEQHQPDAALGAAEHQQADEDQRQAEGERHVDARRGGGAQPLEAGQQRESGRRRRRRRRTGRSRRAATSRHAAAGQHGRRQAHAGLVHRAARVRGGAGEPVEERRLARQLHAVAPRQDPVAVAHQVLHDDRLARLALGVKRRQVRARRAAAPPTPPPRSTSDEHDRPRRCRSGGGSAGVRLRRRRRRASHRSS